MPTKMSVMDVGSGQLLPGKSNSAACKAHGSRERVLSPFAQALAALTQHGKLPP
jgi:hypothetical protein